MNYKSQLKGWGIDRATEFHKVAGTKDLTVEQLLETAKILADNAYIVDEDIEKTVLYVADLIKQSADPLTHVEQLLNTFEFMREQITAQMPKVQPIQKAN